MFTPRISLDQWRAFHAVVEYGGFAQASVALNRSQSSISYNIKQLQQQLGLSLLEIRGRKAELTANGQSLLLRAEHLLQQAQDLESFAHSLEQGWEPGIRLVVDTAFPSELLMRSLARFSQKCPNIRVQLVEEVLSGVEEAVTSGNADLAIAGSASDDRMDELLMELEFIAVAHPQHALHQLGRQITENDLIQQTQVIISDSGSSAGVDIGWLSAETRWAVSSAEKAVNSLLAGLGFAWLPRRSIQAHLDHGELKPLDLEHGQCYRAFLYLMYGKSRAPGPGTRLLADLIREQARTGNPLVQEGT